MSDDRVDEAGDEETVDEISGEGASFGDGARDDGGGGGGEDELEEPLGPLVLHAVAGEVGVADEGVGVIFVAVSESVAKEPIGESAEKRVQQILDENIGGVFAAHRTALEVGETRL